MSDNKLPVCLFPLIDLRDERGGFDVHCCNQKLVELMDRLIEDAKQQRSNALGSERSRHTNRITSFTRAKDSIRGCSTMITSGKQAQLLPNIGKGIATRIDEFLRTGKLAELEKDIDPKTRVLMELMTITGVGEAKAQQLYDLGVTGIQDLKDKYQKGIIKVAKNQMTHHIKLGLEYHDDLQKRIPWEEVNEIRSLLIEVALSIDEDLDVEVCGSYRRGRPTCGDIDVLLTKSNKTKETSDTVLIDFVERLTADGFLVGNLTKKGDTKYMGICKLTTDGIGRRIDIRCVTSDEFPAAQLYFTGSGNFNKLMRYKANERGFTLNEYGIYYYINGTIGDKIPVKSEKDIFKVLNFVYLEPHEREF